MPITKHNYLVQDIHDLPRIIKEAYFIAGTGRPGPVLIDIPKVFKQKKISMTEYNKLYEVPIQLEAMIQLIKVIKVKLRRLLRSLKMLSALLS